MRRESATWNAWPRGKRGHRLHSAKYHRSSLAMVLSRAWTEQMQRELLGRVCCSAGDTTLVLYFANETSTIDLDAASIARQMPGRVTSGSSCRRSRDLHLISRKVLQPCGRDQG